MMMMIKQSTKIFFVVIEYFDNIYYVEYSNKSYRSTKILSNNLEYQFLSNVVHYQSIVVREHNDDCQHRFADEYIGVRSLKYNPM